MLLKKAIVINHFFQKDYSDLCIRRKDCLFELFFQLGHFNIRVFIIKKVSMHLKVHNSAAITYIYLYNTDMYFRDETEIFAFSGKKTSTIVREFYHIYTK